MARNRTEADRLVIERIRQSPGGATAAQIAVAFLGERARRHGYRALEQMGLGIASRLCGAGLISPTGWNRFVVR